MNISFAGLNKMLDARRVALKLCETNVVEFTNKLSVKLSIWQGIKTMDEI
jgi:hypothetical protein